MSRTQSIVISSILVALASVSVRGEQFTPGNFRLISSQRISMYQYDYSYSVDVANNGAEASNVRCTVTSTAPQTVVRSGQLEFDGVASGATVTSINTLVIRQDRRYPFSWSNLEWQWSWTPATNPWIQAAGPEGAHLQYPNGVVLDIPPGALDDVTNLEVRDLPADQADSVLLARSSNASHQKRYLGGFAVTEDVQFKIPIKATFPVLPLQFKEIPIPVEFDLARETYWITDNKLTYRGNEGLAELEVMHFSETGLTGATVDPCKDIQTLEDSLECNERERRCRDCSSNTEADCQSFATPLEPRCCMIYAKNRAQCAWAKDCNCCTQRTIDVLVSGSDMSSSDCQVVGGSVQVTFRDCPNSPTSDASFDGEISAGCPKDLKVEIAIAPSSLSLYVCEEQQLSATVTGKSSAGDVPFAPDLAGWYSDLPGVASVLAADGNPLGVFGSPVNVRGIGAGTTKAWARIADTKAAGYADIQVRERQVTPNTRSVDVEEGSQFNVTVSVEGICSTCQMRWSSSDLTVARVDNPSTGLITGVAPGDSIVNATLEKTAYADKVGSWCSQDFQTQVTVHVSSIVATVEVIPSDIILGTGVSKQLEAILRKKNGLPITDRPVHWSSSDPAIASVDSFTGMVVAGSQEGTATITAEADGKTGSATVRVRLIMSVSIMPAEASVDVGGAVDFVATAKDADGNIIVPLESDVSWRINNPSVALLTMMGMRATASANAPGTATVTVSVHGVEGTAILSVNRLGLFVKAKIGDCGWNAPYCEFPAVLQPVPVTIMAGYRQSDGSIRYQSGISIDARPGGVGTTDENGVFQFSTQATSKTLPSIRIWVIPNGNADSSILVGAISRDFCSSDSYGTYDGSQPRTCTGGAQCEGSFSFSYKSAIGRAKVDVLSDPGFGFVSYYGEWWDTLLVVPMDMSQLGVGFDMLFSVTSSGSGEARKGDGIASQPTSASWAAVLGSVYASGTYTPDSPPSETNQSEVPLQWHTPLGQSVQIHGLDYMSASAATPCIVNSDGATCTPASSFAQFETKINSLTIISGAPTSFRVLSCSGTEY